MMILTGRTIACTAIFCFGYLHTQTLPATHPRILAIEG